MITAEDFEARWKGSELSRLGENSIATQYISEQSREFLVKAGLPRETFFEAEFSFDLSEDKLKFFDGNMVEVSKDDISKRYLQIGKQLSSLICINLENEEIIILRTRLKKTEFVSSSVNRLAELIIIFDEVFDKFREGKIDRKNKKEVKSEADFLLHSVKQIDEKALTTETVWTEMIEIIEGML